MELTAPELRALLAAYLQVKQAAWPDLHPTMARNSAKWAAASLDSLSSELADYLREIGQPDCPVRVFWKLGPELAFRGCNVRFARDAGLTPEALLGMTDFDPRLPWARQAAKYRLDDETITRTGQPKLDILERQNSASGTVWVRAAKAPVQLGAQVLGLVGMYEVLSPEVARARFADQLRHRDDSPT